MSGELSAETVEAEHLRAFGPQLGPLFHALYGEVVWLHAKWQEFCHLFAHSEDRVELLNDAAPHFFRIIQDMLWQDVALSIARLTDPPKQNLTLLALPKEIEDPSLADEIRALVKKAEASSVFARTWRNKHFAHRDLSIATGASASPLPEVTQRQIEDALASIRDVMSRMYSAYVRANVDIRFEPLIAHGDARDLVYHLKESLRMERGYRDYGELQQA